MRKCDFESGILRKWDLGKDMLGKGYFGKVGYWESGILVMLDLEQVGFWGNEILGSRILGNWDFEEVLGSLDLGKLSFWKKLDFGTLGFCKVGKVGFWECWIWGKWDFGEIGF